MTLEKHAGYNKYNQDSGVRVRRGKAEDMTDEEVEHFIEYGYVVIRGAFTREQAEGWLKDVFPRLGYDENDPTTWTQARIHMPSHNRVNVAEFAPRVWEAIKVLLGGEDRIQKPAWGDGFIVNLGTPEDADTWQPASAEVHGWHKDGDFFRHFLDSPEQGLLTIVLWSDVQHKGGPTYIAADSVPVVARFLAEHPEGVRPGEFGFQNLIQQCRDFREATGNIGDVFLLHPYMLHTVSKNALRIPRLITNPPVHLKEPMRFDREDPKDFSPVERAILRGLGVERLDYVPTGEREKIVPERVLRQQKMMEEEKARLAAAESR